MKSAAWDDSGVLVYTTLNHIKYCLPNGDSGIIRTLEVPVYITKVFGNLIFCLDRDGKNRQIQVCPRLRLCFPLKTFELLGGGSGITTLVAVADSAQGPGLASHAPVGRILLRYIVLIQRVLSDARAQEPSLNAAFQLRFRTWEKTDGQQKACESGCFNQGH